jgi:hypothetical protein
MNFFPYILPVRAILAAGLRMSQGGSNGAERRDRSDELGDCRGTKETGMLRREFVTSGSAIFPFGISRVIAAGTVLVRQTARSIKLSVSGRMSAAYGN